MSGSVERFISAAARQAELSAAPNFRLGAIVVRGKNIIGSGFNIADKTHPVHARMYPERAYRGLHAEISATRGLRPYDLRNSLLYVVRLLRDDSLKIKKKESFMKYLKDK